MKIFDCFTFYNEEEILKIRLNELNDVVDFFVIVEADRTFTGKPKPFNVDHDDWINQFKDKIIRVYASLPADCPNAWESEWYQRNSITEVSNYADELDLCVISDVDEIPRPAILASAKIAFDLDLPIRLDVDQYFWNFNWLAPQHCNQGARPIVCRVGDLNESTPQELRASNSFKTISNAGWHFSFLADYSLITNKIEAFAHTEYNSEEYKDYQKVKYRIDNGIDPFDRFPLKYTKIDKTYPKYIQENYKDG